MRPGPDWFIWLEALGILSFAVNAMIAANAKSLSALGMFTCAAVTALGGGTFRDILLGAKAQPFFWIAHPFYVVMIFVVAVAYAAAPTVRSLIARRNNFIKEIAEAAALASLGSLGATKAFAILAPDSGPGITQALQIWIVCAFLGAMGAAFGSVIRDVLLNELPSALQRKSHVLESVFIGAGVLVGMRMAEISTPWAMLGGFLVTFLLKLAATMRNSTVANETRRPS